MNDVFGIKLSLVSITQGYAQSKTGLNPESPKIKACFRPTPDLSIVNFTSLANHDGFKNADYAIKTQLEDGSSYDNSVWNYIVSFDEKLILNKKIIPSNIKIISTPQPHPSHCSIVPESYDHSIVLNNAITSNMYFNLKTLSQVYAAIIENGTLHKQV